MPIPQLMKFWAASGKADNCKTRLPNFHSQLHCKVITDMTNPAKLTEVCVNTHVRMGSTTFSLSQGNLAAQRGQENKEQMILVLPAMLNVAGPLFSSPDNLNLQSPLQENHRSFHYWCCSHGQGPGQASMDIHPSQSTTEWSEWKGT